MTFRLFDMFSGIGGSSEGASRVPGVEVALAVNHWQLAVDTHARNHPGADHDVADLSVVHPRRYPRTELLWASPACTHHSRAQGKRREQPALFGSPPEDVEAERSRATMWHVIEFIEHHRYPAVVIENVYDVTTWALWPSWQHALRALRYAYRILCLDAAWCQVGGEGTPQSRTRLFIAAWPEGNRAPDLDKWTRPRAYCPGCDRTVTAMQAWKRPGNTIGAYGNHGQWVWRCPNGTCRHQRIEPICVPGSTVVDWSRPSPAIDGGRKPATRHKVALGVQRYGGQPFIAELRGGGSTTRSLDRPLSTITAGGTHHGLVIPPRPGATVDECGWRMLGPHELKQGQGLPPTYILDGQHDDMIRMVGNGVPPPPARDLISAHVEALSGEQVAA